MTNIYIQDPYCTTLETCVVAAAPRDGGGSLLALEDTIARGAGGGQPADRAAIAVGALEHQVRSIAKADNRTWYELPTLGELPLPGAEVRVRIDGERRHRLMRCHSLIHLVMAGLRWTVPGYESRGAEIEEDATTCHLYFAADLPQAHSDFTAADMYARSKSGAALPILTGKVKSLDEGRRFYPHWRVDPSSTLSGRIRVIEIADGVDANPCSGTHVRNTSEIEAFSVSPGRWRPDLGCFTLIARLEASWMYWYGEMALARIPARK